MNDKKRSQIVTDAIDDKYIEEAADAEGFFARRKIFLPKRRRALKLIPTLVACVAIVLAISISAALLAPLSDPPTTDGGYDGDVNNGSGNSGNTGSWDDIWGNLDDGSDDTTGDGTEDPWTPWDEVKYFTVPNTSATINVVDVDTKAGFAADNGYTSNAANATGLITNVTLAKGSAMVFEYKYTGTGKAGVQFEDIIVYFSADGKVNVAKSTDAGETVVASSSAAVYAAGATVAIDWNGSNTVKVKVNGAEVLSATVSVDVATGNIALVADAAGAKFQNLKIALSGSALIFETRFLATWEVVDDGSKHDGSLYTGYTPDSALNDKSLALINNVGFENAKKITLTGKMAVGKDWRTQDPETKKYSGNQNCGFIFNVWNDDEYMPIFWEDKDACSYFYIFFSGNSMSVSQGKWGATTFDKTYYNNNNGWYSLPGSTANIPDNDGDGKPDDDGIPDEATITKGEPLTSVWNYGEYYELKVIWDVENYTLTSYCNGELTQITQFTKDIFATSGDRVGIRTNSGDVYYREFVLEVE